MALTVASHRRRMRRAVVILFVAVILMAGSYILFWGGTRAFRRKYWHSQDPLLTTTPAPYTDFIDPASESFRRKFYIWISINPDPKRRKGQQNNADTTESLQSGVTVFVPKVRRYDLCVPFAVPGNTTARICIYDPREDPFISSFVRDRGTWEADQVALMAYLMGLDKDYEMMQRDAGPGPAEDEQNQEKIVLEGLGPRTSARLHDAGMSLVDIGCNIGTYALSATVLGYQVLAMDPVKDSLQLLADSLRLNNLTERATLLLNAVSDVRGPVIVEVNGENRGGTWVRHAEPGAAIDSPGPVVRAVCLDDLTRYVRTPRVFLKMDIEGSEERALRCAGQFFQHVDVRYVLMEWLFHRNSKGGAAIIHFLTRNGLLPYSDVQPAHRHVLLPENYHTWPDNVFWIKR